MVDVSERNRVSKGRPDGGRFAKETKARPVPLNAATERWSPEEQLIIAESGECDDFPLTDDDWAGLANSPVSGVRERVAESLTVPYGVWQDLVTEAATDRDLSVCEAGARSHHLDEYVSSELVATGDTDVLI